MEPTPRSASLVGRLIPGLLFALLLLTPALLLGAAGPEPLTGVPGTPAEPLSGGGDWHAKSLAGAVGLTALFGLVGIALAFIGYKFFDKCTPGDMHKEIFENKNIAVAIVAAAVILGICLIIAAAIMG